MKPSDFRQERTQLFIFWNGPFGFLGDLKSRGQVLILNKLLDLWNRLELGPADIGVSIQEPITSARENNEEGRPVGKRILGFLAIFSSVFRSYSLASGSLSASGGKR